MSIVPKTNVNFIVKKQLIAPSNNQPITGKSKKVLITKLVLIARDNITNNFVFILQDHQTTVLPRYKGTIQLKWESQVISG